MASDSSNVRSYGTTLACVRPGEPEVFDTCENSTARMMFMNTPAQDEASREAEGVIQQVDSVNRDLKVLVQGRVTLFDVPVDCTILLHGEAVKLRLLQPRDR